jgi:hypothetical protein
MGNIQPLKQGTISLIILSFSDWELASGFKLDAGSQEVKIPRDLQTRNSYIIVLIGDSGNASPQFTIDSIRDKP